jgi:hypothetical protein
MVDQKRVPYYRREATERSEKAPLLGRGQLLISADGDKNLLSTREEIVYVLAVACTHDTSLRTIDD